MAGLTVNLEKCRGCGKCVKTCAAKALSVTDKKAVVSADCVLCGVCVDSCPFGALSIEKDEGAGKMTDCSGVWVFAECNEAGPLPVAYELLGKGRVLADARGCALTALLIGGAAEQYAGELIAYGADRVLLCEGAAYAAKLESPYADVTAAAIRAYRPEIVLYGATGFGRAFAPRVAAKMGTGLTADCTVLEIDPATGLLQQTRPAFGGNLMATIVCPNHRPQMATVRPGIMAALQRDGARAGETVRFRLEQPKACGVELLRAIASGETESIKDAKIIVSAGRGVGSQKNLQLVRELAALLGGAFGVSRPLVDTGWSEYKHQIGQTGCTVAPDLLICCGISGAIQHLAGISGAKTIVAINNDPDAPIFSVAHYKIVADCMEVVKELIAVAKAAKV